MTRHETTGSAWRGISEWTLGILGAVAAFVGLFILVAEGDQSVGLGGDWSWRVDEIAPAWGYGLLAGGIVAVLLALGLLLTGRRAIPLQGQRRARVELIWHAVVFLVVNAFVWLQDIAVGGGVDYAYWITIPWGIGLVIHAVTVTIGSGRNGQIPSAPR